MEVNSAYCRRHGYRMLSVVLSDAEMKERQEIDAVFGRFWTFLADLGVVFRADRRLFPSTARPRSSAWAATSRGPRWPCCAGSWAPRSARCSRRRSAS